MIIINIQFLQQFKIMLYTYRLLYKRTAIPQELYGKNIVWQMSENLQIFWKIVEQCGLLIILYITIFSQYFLVEER
jgi:hypothetical protein